MPKRRHGRAMSDAIPVPADSAKRKQRPAAGGCGSTDLAGRHPTDLSDGASRPSGGMQRFPSRRRTPFRRGGSGGNHSPRWGMGRRPICLSSTISGGTSPAERRLLCLSPKTGGMFPPAGSGATPHCSGLSIFFNMAHPSAFSAKAPPKHGASTALNLMRSRLIRLRSTRSERGRPRLRRRSAVRAGRPR